MNVQADPYPILVLFSGGIGSMILAERVLASQCELITLHARYSHSNAAGEYRAVTEWHRLKWLAGHKIRHIEISPSIRSTDTHTQPARDEILLTYAINIASSIGARQVWHGINDTGLDDCLGSIATWPDIAREWGIMLQTPLIEFKNRQLRNEARYHGIIQRRIVMADGSKLYPGSCCDIETNQRHDMTTGEIDCVSCGESLGILEESIAHFRAKPIDQQSIRGPK